MSDIAIKVSHVSKTFKIPHEKISSLRGAVTGAFKKGGYEEFKALDDVSFEVKKGEFFGIIGRNGSGKSTLLKILAGIYQPDEDVSPKAKPSEHRRLNLRKAEQKVKINGRISPFLEFGIGFNPELSGRDNTHLNATMLGMTKVV
jgi:ABC-2 type transport system ATP-binding protein